MASEAVAAIPRKSPVLALVLSLLWSGLGQLYNGQLRKGALLMVVYLISVVLVSVSIGFVTTPLLWVYGMADAYRTAGRLTREGGAQRHCPHCGKSISVTAHSCRFCGRAAVVRAT